MPRKLPWKVKSATTVVSPKRVVTSKTSAPKRQRRDKIGSEDGDIQPRDADKNERPPSSSPPPEPPVENLMKDGMDHDDKYRMVEDEFLTVAQRFTMHLHAAEYKRQQNVAKTRNAASISSISRPVAGKMPDHTRRKVEAVARARSQRAAVESLSGKKSDHSDDSDDGEELPYVGTTLHGLMDSPRKKTASLAKPGAIATATRAAAGFKKPVKLEQNTTRHLSQDRKPSELALKNESGGSNDSSDDFDDLDGPVPAPKLSVFKRKSSTWPQVDKTEPESTTSISRRTKQTAKPSSSIGNRRLSVTEEVESYTKEVDSRPPILEHARRRRFKQEKKPSTDDFDVIPTFL